MASSGQMSCDSCPVGKYNADNSTDASYHDSLDDCLLCRRGFYADSEGMAECTSCVAGKYMAEFIDGQPDSEDDCTVRTGIPWVVKLEPLSLVPADHNMPSLIAANPLAPPSLTLHVDMRRWNLFISELISMQRLPDRHLPRRRRHRCNQA